MTDFLIDKAIENVGGGDTTPVPMQLDAINVPLFEADGKDPYDSIPLAVHQSNEEATIQAMYREARAAAEEREPTGGQTMGDKATEVKEEAFDYMGKMAKDAGESMKQVFVGGPLDAAQSLLNTGLDVGQWTYEKLGIPATNERFTFVENIVPPSEAPALRFQRGMVEYYSAFAGAKVITKGIQAASFTMSAINGMVADFISTDPREEKIQELLKKNPELISPFVTAMHGEDNDANLWEKVAYMYQGALVGLGIEGATVLGKQALKSLMATTKNYKLARQAKGVADKELVDSFAKGANADGVVVEEVLTELPPPVSKIQTAEADALIEDIKQGRGVSKAFNMTLAGITNKKEVQRVIKAIADNAIEKFAAQKGGVKSRELLQKEADALGLTIDKLLRRQRGTPTWDAMNRASADVMEKTMEDFIEASAMYEKGLLGHDDYMAATQVAEAIALQVSDMATMSGRAEQAWQAVGQATPSAVKRAKKLEEIAYLYGDNLKDRAKAIAKLGRLDKKLTQRATEYANAQGRLIPSWNDVILAVNNWRLSNLVTHGRNIISNTTQSVGAVSDSFFAEMSAAVRGHGEHASGETVQMVRGMFSGFGDAMATAYQNIKNPKNMVPIFEDATKYTKAGQMEIANELTSVGKAAGVIKYAVRGDAVGAALGAADDVFKLINYRGEIRKQAHLVATLRDYQGESYDAFVASFIKDPPPEFHVKALDAARENTFTRDRVGLGLKIEQLVRDPAWFGVDRLVLPFIGTNLNVLEQTLMRTPVIGLLTTRARQAIAESATNPRALDKLVGKQATGAAFLGTMAYFMGEGKLFQPSIVGDKNREQFAKSVGVTPSSFKFGNDYVNLDALSPMTGTVKFLANMKSLYDIASDDQKMKLDDAMQVAAFAVGDLMNPTFITDAGGAFVNAVITGDLEEMRYVFTGLGSSVVPYNGLVRQLTKDGTKIDTRVAGGLDKWFEEFTNNMNALIAPEGMPRQRDLFGREVKASEGITNPMDPFTKTSMATDPVTKEIIRLVQADKMAVMPDDETKLVLSKPRRTIIKKIGGIEKKYDLNANEYERLVMFCAGEDPEIKKYLPTKYDMMKKIMDSNGYKKRPDYQKKAIVASIQKAYADAGEKLFFQTTGRVEDYVNHVRSVLIQRSLLEQ